MMTENEIDLTLRERVGKSLLNNKISILGAILLVLFISQIIKFTLPDLLISLSYNKFDTQYRITLSGKPTVER